MKKLITYIFLCTLIIAPCVYNAQISRVDSLLSVISNSSNDSVKIKIYNELFFEYEYSEVLKARDCLNKSLRLAKNNNYEAALAKIYLYLGYLEEDNGNLSAALENYLNSLKLFEKHKNPEGMSSVYNSIGTIYQSQNEDVLSLKYFLLSLKFCDSLNDNPGKASAFNNLGIGYDKLGEFEDALKNYYSSLKISIAIGDKEGVARTYMNIAVVNREMGDYAGALKNNFEALGIAQNIGNKVIVSGTLCNIGAIYIRQKNYKEASDCLKKAEIVSKESGNIEFIGNVYLISSQLDSSTGNYTSAFNNYKRYVVYRDSLNNEETRKKTIQSQMTYDFEKKEAVAEAEHKKELENQEILSEEKSRKQKIVLALVLGSLLLVIVFAGFIFKSLRTTRKQKALIEQQKNVVEEQKQEVELQKLLVEEKQKEIIDSINYARRIQRSQLPTEKYIEKSLKRLMKK